MEKTKKLVINPKHYKIVTHFFTLDDFSRDEYLKFYKAKDNKSQEYKNFIKDWRNFLNETPKSLTIVHKKSGVSHEYDVQPEQLKTRNGDLFKQFSTDFVKNILNKKRQELRTLKPTKKEFYGANYLTYGGVFTAKNAVNELAKRLSINDPKVHKKPGHRKENFVGVELEFNNDLDVGCDFLNKLISDNNLGKYVNVGTDHCGFELRCLFPEVNFDVYLTKLLKLLKDEGFSGVRDCGSHVHLDMRNRDPRMVYHNLVYAQTFLRKFLTKNRKNNTRYCAKNDVYSYDEHLSSKSRYYGINPFSYDKHRTIEVRMHQGTLDEKLLVPWIKLLIKLASHNSKIESKEVKTLKQASEIFSLEDNFKKELASRILLTRNVS